MILINGRSVSLWLSHKRNPTHGRAPTRAGGIIRWEYCSWPLGATRRAELPSANPYSYPKIECRTTSAAWPWRVLHLDNFDTLSAKFSGKFLSSTVIRNQAPYSVKGPIFETLLRPSLLKS